MFGNNAVTSSWAPQQQPQQPQQGSGFGQPSTFGSGGTFGSTGFNQPQQPAQTNPIFGNLSAPQSSGATPTTGFGAFSGGTGAFGAPKPATGFGSFGGGTSTFGSGGVFGSGVSAPAGSNSGTGLFGQTGSGGFGGTPSLFGATKAATTFGTPSNQMENVPLVTTGTANPPWSPFTEKDPSNANVNAMLHYQSITSMPHYRGTSFEELRLQDYQQGRRTAGAFGQSASFGTAPTSGLFGQSSQPGAAQSSNIFGSGGSFGATNQAAGTSAFGTFGQPPPSQAQQGPSLFGSGGAFGQQPQQQSASGFGSFVTQPQPPNSGAGTGIFGTGAFGGQQKSAFGTSTFGGGGTFSQPQQPAPSIFGQQTQPSQSQGTSTFGNGAFGKPSIFGNTQPTSQPTQGFGMFGTAAQSGQPTSGTFGSGTLFGQTPNQQQQQQQQPPNNTQVGLFGNAQGNQQPAPSSIFGAGGGGLFGNASQPPQQNQPPAPQGGFAGSAFNLNQPAANTGSLFGFGKPAAPATSLFGNPVGQPTMQQPAAGQGTFVGLFNNNNNRPTAPQLGTAPSAPMGGIGTGSLFGTPNVFMGSVNATATAPGAEGTLTASIAQPIAASLPIFSMLPPGPRSVDLDLGQKKKTSFLIDVPTRQPPIPGLGLSYRNYQVKPRGFTSIQPTSSPLFSEAKPEALDMNQSILDNRTTPAPDPWIGRGMSSMLGSGGRQSVKKLILDRKIDSTDLMNTVGGSPGRRGGLSRVTFSPALGIAEREREATGIAPSSSPFRPQDSPTPAVRPPNKFSAQKAPSPEPEPTPPKPVDPSELEEGEYWLKPDLETLKRYSHEELSACKDLVVGRVGYGEIHFLDPVDLTGLPKLSSLVGQIVRFDDKECSVYPDYDEADKPAIGTGLNVRARIILLRCWASDKATREPIKDEIHVAAIKHLKRLKNMKDTTFEEFDIKDGRWSFTVEHF